MQKSQISGLCTKKCFDLLKRRIRQCISISILLCIIHLYKETKISFNREVSEGLLHRKVFVTANTGNCTGRAAEELKYGRDGMSTINQRRLVTARRIAAKLVYSGAMTDNPDWQSAPLATPFENGNGSLLQMIPERVRQSLPLELSSVSQSRESCLKFLK